MLGSLQLEYFFLSDFWRNHLCFYVLDKATYTFVKSGKNIDKTMSVVQSESGKNMSFRRTPAIKTIFDFADENRNVGRFSDVTINVKQQTIPANKIILAYFSKYFESMFTTEMSEKYQNEVEIKNQDPMAVKLIIDYFYSGIIVIDGGNVLNVLAAADYMQAQDVKDFCFQYLESGLTVGNCLDTIRAYTLFKPEASLGQAVQFLSKQLCEISLLENFRVLSKNDLTSILAKLDQNVVAESSKYIAIINWVKYDVETRKTNFAELFQLIDLPRIEIEFLEDVIATDALIKENHILLNAVFECHISYYKKKRATSKGSKILCLHKNTVLEIQHQRTFSDVETAYPKLPVGENANTKLLFANGSLSGIGSEREAVRAFQIKLTDTDVNWKEVVTLEESRTSFGAAVFNSYCFIIAGGKYGNVWATDSVALYDIHINKWKNISCLKQPRYSHSLVSCHIGVFALGGYSGRVLSTVERLCHVDGKWELVSSMQTPRYAFAAVFCDDYIYAIGGYSYGKSRNDVEKYDPSQNKWSTVASMIFKRYSHSACVWRGKIIVVGGLNDAKRPVKEIERYDPAGNTWSVAGTANSNLYEHELVVV